MAHQRRSTFYNAKLLVNDLQIAPLIQKPTQDGLVYREEIGIGVKLLMESKHGVQLRERAASLKLHEETGRRIDLKL